jgi:hypothetical protein
MTRKKGVRLRYEQVFRITSSDNDDVGFLVRRNGKAFAIDISPSHFVNSPVTTKKYLSYVKVLQPGQDVLDDIHQSDAFDWALQPFEPYFAELAPSPPAESFKITLRDYQFPEYFVFVLYLMSLAR